MAARDRRDFSEILIRKGLITPVQLAEAKKKGGAKVAEALVVCGFVSEEDVMRAMAEQHGVDYVNLREVTIPKSVAELIPESLAREHAVLPLSADDGQITILISNPWDFETLDKLRFILNRRIDIALAPKSSIEAAINRVFQLQRMPAMIVCSRSRQKRRRISPIRMMKSAPVITWTRRALPSFVWYTC